jgi:hypothetical protein
MGKPVWTMTSGEKIEEGLIRGFAKVPGAGADVIASFITPQNIVIMSATFLLWAASHAVGVGEAVDIALLVVGAIALGPSTAQAIEKLIAFSKVTDARTDLEIDIAAQAFADARSSQSTWCWRCSCGAPPKAFARRTRARPGSRSSPRRITRRFSPVEAEPYAGEWWSKPKTEQRTGPKLEDAGDAGIKIIHGETSSYGDI